MKKILRTFLLMAFAFIGISMISSVQAASASMKANTTKATVGDDVTITVTINAQTWNIHVTGTGVSGGNYVGYSFEGTKTTTETLKLDTSTAGSKTIVLSGDVSDDSGITLYDGKENPMPTVTVVVSEKPVTNTGTNANSNTNTTTQKPTTTTSPAKSSDASIKSITVNGQSYTVGKTMTVNADTSSVTISATANSSKATVSGTGTKELVTGTNVFYVKVTAEDGTSKSYKVMIIREEYVEDKPNIIEQNSEEQTPKELRLISLALEGVELIPVFDSEVFEYSAYITEVEEIKVVAVANIEDATVEITGNTDLIEGENIVTIKITKDENVVEYKIKVNKVVLNKEQEQTEEPKQEKKIAFIGIFKDWWNKSGPITVAFTCILMLLGGAVIFAVTSYKYSKEVHL